jgi:hypothetical protein
MTIKVTYPNPGLEYDENMVCEDFLNMGMLPLEHFMGYYYLEWGWGLSKIRKLDLNLQVTIIHDDFGSVTHSSGYLALRVRVHRYIH